MTDSAQIAITEDGPYIVSGTVPLTEQRLTVDAEGSTWDFADTDSQPRAGGEQYALCRCGASLTKPFCDGSHAKVGFDGTEVAGHTPFAQSATRIPGPGLDLDDDEPLCAFARICDGHGNIWSTVSDTDDPEVRQTVAHQGSHCPSGRLVVSDTRTGEVLEIAFDPSIVLLEDPQENAGGPLWVRGGIPITGADGVAYETRNRVTLCRCGASSNKPFCDGTHAHIDFDSHS